MPYLAWATARKALKLAASAKLGVPVTGQRTVNGSVITSDGAALPYADVATDAAKHIPPQVDLRPKSDWKLLGYALPRKDLSGKSTGTATYGIDMRHCDALRIHNAPAFEVQFLETGPDLTGVGEPGTPPSMPALANALFDLTGRQATRLPLILGFDLLT